MLLGELIATFQKLVNKIHASPLFNENLHTAQSGRPTAEHIVEIQEDDVNESNDPATNMVHHYFH